MTQDLLMVKIIDAKGDLLEILANSVMLPGEQGSFMVLPDHTNILSQLKSGLVVINQQDKELRYFLRIGIAHIIKNRVDILSNEVILDLQEADANNIHNEVQKLEEALSHGIGNLENINNKLTFYRESLRILAKS
ncbi:ATP synthase epsilon chain [Rickettsiales endosymbiont of Paramecium tredecaurelia]|uniref:ATP synthase F1 subunit epsilon n=1 Tax=Candidatus Sarmatiella mevalonica TaxID=2770581 RepID=UPI001923233B|nr:ATP synthase F1 subunit epsilon [Candidatus Sarmatiella mevalonica]MBL3285064.1 ATP synthase epsilon chain [Candidatus Sarmatiella mevalonica]